MITRKQLEEQLSRKSPGWWQSVQEMVGRENYYYDRACKFGLVTVDLHAGTTPMFVKCMGRKGMCSGVMASMGYPDPSGKPPWLGPATHEWYRPDEIDDESESPEADHLMNGGLLLRKIKEGDREQD